MPPLPLLLNAAGFQLAWWALVASVPSGLELGALALGLALGAAHLRWSARPRAEIRLATLAWLVGVAVDTSLQLAGVIAFRGWSLGPLSPAWLWMLWALFGLTLDASMAFLQRHHWAVSAVAGGVFGPLSYWAGARLGAASFVPSAANVAALALAWTVAMPLLVQLARTGPNGLSRDGAIAPESPQQTARH